MVKDKKACPNCDSKVVIPIVCGYSTEELGREAREGKFI